MESTFGAQRICFTCIHLSSFRERTFTDHWCVERMLFYSRTKLDSVLFDNVSENFDFNISWQFETCKRCQRSAKRKERRSSKWVLPNITIGSRFNQRLWQELEIHETYTVEQKLWCVSNPRSQYLLYFTLNKFLFFCLFAHKSPPFVVYSHLHTHVQLVFLESFTIMYHIHSCDWIKFDSFSVCCISWNHTCAHKIYHLVSAFAHNKKIQSLFERRYVRRKMQ